MKIALVCSHGGHLTEMLSLMEAFEGHDIFFVTYENQRTRNMAHRKYLMKNIGVNPFRLLLAFARFFIIFAIEKPRLIVSTGSEIAIPAFYVAKLLGIERIYIESWCRVENPSVTGKIVYPVSNIFLVQWPQLLSKYGRKAKFEGAVV